MRSLVIIIICLVGWCSINAQPVVSLDSCRAMALRGNKDLLSADAEIEKAGYQRREARAAYFPALDLEAMYLYNSRKLSLVDQDQLLPTKNFNPATGAYDFNLVTDPATGYPVQVNGQYVPAQVALLPKSALTYNIHNVFAGALTLTQPLFMGGKIKAMNDITRYAEQLSVALRDNKARDVIYNVDAAYWQVVSLKAKQQLAEAYVDLLKHLQSDVQAMVNEGVATRASQLTVDVKLNEAEVDLTKVNNGLSLSRMALAQLCGVPVNTPMRLADEDNTTWNTQARPLNVDMEQVYAARSDVKALELATHIYDGQARVAKSDMLPKLAAMAAFHVTNPNSYNGFKNRFAGAFSVGVTLKVPIWHWGGKTAKYRAAQTEARIKRIELDNVKEKIELQVNQAQYRYQESLKTLQATRANLDKANENLRVANVAFKEGMSTTDDVMTAQTAWLKANSEHIDAEIDVKLCDVYLAKVLGADF